MLPPGPEQSWLMMTLRRDCADAGSMSAMNERASARKRRGLAEKITFLSAPLPHSPFFGSVDSSGFKIEFLRSADSKRVMGSSGDRKDSAWLTRKGEAGDQGPGEHISQCNRLVHLCQAKSCARRVPAESSFTRMFCAPFQVHRNVNRMTIQRSERASSNHAAARAILAIRPGARCISITGSRAYLRRFAVSTHNNRRKTAAKRSA